MKLLIEIEDRDIEDVIGGLCNGDLCPSLLSLDECDCGKGCWNCWTNALKLDFRIGEGKQENA